MLEDDTPESEISTPDLEDETPAIRDKKPISRPEEEDIETGVSGGDSPASQGREQIVHVGSSRWGNIFVEYFIVEYLGTESMPY